MVRSLPAPDTAILIHGRHTSAPGWEEMMWGDAATDNLGSTPTAVLSILDENPDRVKLVTIGSGASTTEEGMVEAKAIHTLLLSRFDQLGQFSTIRNHPEWTENKTRIKELFQDAVLDTTSKNTEQEVALAAGLFAVNGISKVIEVTGASHAPRCAVIQGIARAGGIIPPSQRWRLIADDIPYSNSNVGDTAVFEVPHRGDDPLLQWPPELLPAMVFRQVFALPPDKKREAVRRIAGVFQAAELPDNPLPLEEQTLVQFYGDTPTIQASRDEGYETLTFGRGPWINGSRVVGMVAMFHPDGGVRVLVTRKTRVFNDTLRSPMNILELPTLEAYQAFVRENGVTCYAPAIIEAIPLSKQTDSKVSAAD